MKKKIAVIGGGVAAITAVYAITRDPAWRDKYDITLYQLGWRIGGKGASGRNLSKGGRIEEHGLHVWGGFYDNAFRNMRSCYQELARLGLREKNAPLGSLKKAFKPLRHLLLAEHVGFDGPKTWRPWLIDLPANDLKPGTATSSPTPFDMFVQFLEIVLSFVRESETGQHSGRHLGSEALSSVLTPVVAILQHARSMPAIAGKHSAWQTSMLIDLIESAQAVIRDMETPGNLDHDATRRVLLLMDLHLAVMRGMAASETFSSGYDILDQWEFTEWLRRNGASDAALQSILLRGCYDFVFGYPHGRVLAGGDVGAGTALRTMSRLVLTYRGAIFYKMQAGMGDTIFGPYYQVLSHIGVKFRFFNAATRLNLTKDKTSIASIEMVEQAAVKSGQYDPLVTVENLPCWPSEPLWDQLVDGKRLKESGVDFESEASPFQGRPYTMHAGVDFDQIILGASVGSLRYLTPELAAASTRWRDMLNALKTVGTHAAQFWLNESQDALGWRSEVEAHNPPSAIPDKALRTILTGFSEPLDTWADMTHLLKREAWGKNGPKSIAYFCAPAPDGETLDEFKASVAEWTRDDLTKFWPASREGNGFDDRLLFKAAGEAGSAFEDQYFRVNMHGSERYVLGVTNSVYKRLAPDESGFDNLFLAGDWTRCGLNAGCVEAATISGLAAAEAVTQRPMDIVGRSDIPSDETVRSEAMYQTNTVTGAPWPLSGFYARGELNGWFFFFHLPRAQVQALLPKGIYLAHSHLSPHGMHTVGMSLSRYHNVRSSFLPPFLTMRPYLEASLAIPFVRTAETGRAQFLYPRRLYVTSESAIMIGRLLYDMNKVKADIRADDRSFVASNAQSVPFIEASFQQHDNPQPLAEHPAFGTIATLLNLSFVTRGRTGTSRYNSFNLELDRCYAAPVSGRVRVEDHHNGGFPAADLSLSPLAHDHPVGLPGAVRLWCAWSLTNPLDSARIRRSAAAQSWLRPTY